MEERIKHVGGGPEIVWVSTIKISLTACTWEALTALNSLC